jgi:hypothetical protein
MFVVHSLITKASHFDFLGTLLLGTVSLNEDAIYHNIYSPSLTPRSSCVFVVHSLYISFSLYSYYLELILH